MSQHCSGYHVPLTYTWVAGTQSTKHTFHLIYNTKQHVPPMILYFSLSFDECHTLAQPKSRMSLKVKKVLETPRSVKVSPHTVQAGNYIQTHTHTLSIYIISKSHAKLSNIFGFHNTFFNHLTCPYNLKRTVLYIFVLFLVSHLP